MSRPAVIYHRGIAFVLVGLLKVLCDRWLLETNAQGSKQKHTFDHVFILMFLEQMLQMLLLLLFFAIDKNWMGFKRFYHGAVIRRAYPPFRINRPQRAQPPPQQEPLDHPEENHVQGIEHDNQNGLHDTQQVAQQLANGEAIGAQEEPVPPIPQEPQEPPQQPPQEPPQAPPREPIPEPQEPPNIPGPEEIAEDQRRRRKRRRPSKYLYLIPSLLFLLHRMLVHFGLELTYTSSFMMLKGSNTLFTALLVIAFLAQQLPGHVWLGLLLSWAGFAVSGISDYVNKPTGGGYEKYGIAAGNLLIVMAQICSSCRYVYEEKYIRKHAIHPLKFLGVEAVYGVFFSAIVLAVMCLAPVADYYSYVVPKTHRLEDIRDAAIQLSNCWRIDLAFVGSIVLHVFWNYLGLFMVRDVGALPRVMIETLLWLFYWIICLSLDWENFFVGQVPALCAIFVGCLFYANILPSPACCQRQPANINRNPANRQGLGQQPGQGEAGANQDVAINNGNVPHHDAENVRDDDDVAINNVRDDDDEPLLPVNHGDDRQQQNRHGPNFDDPMIQA